MAGRDVAQDGRSLGEDPVAFAERRHARLGVDAEIFRTVLLVGGKVDARQLEPRPDLLKHNVGRQRTRAGAIVELHSTHCMPRPVAV